MINAKNQATLEAGQREMAGLREQRGLSPNIVPDHDKDLPYLPEQPNYTYHPNAPPPENNHMTALPQMNKDDNGWVRPHGTALEDAAPVHGGPSGGVDDGRSYATNDDEYYYSSTAQQQGRGGTADKFEKRMRKLMKRRPVGL